MLVLLDIVVELCLAVGVSTEQDRYSDQKCLFNDRSLELVGNDPAQQTDHL